MSQLTELQQRAASFVESAYEAGYDTAAEVAYNAGYDDGYNDGARQGFENGLDTSNTPPPFEADPGDACDCEFCTGSPLLTALNTYFDATDEEPCDCPLCTGEQDDGSLKIALTGDYAADVPSLVQGLRVMVDDSDKLGELVLLIDEDLQELEARVELAEADAVLLEALNTRLTAVEARLNGEL